MSIALLVFAGTLPSLSGMASVGLFATCLVDSLRPSVGLAAVRLLRQAGCEVSLPPGQTCCGQPGYNNGDEKGALRAARRVLRDYAAYDYLVAPSGSCLATIKVHYPRLMAQLGTAEDQKMAATQAARSWELLSFLHHRQLKPRPLPEPQKVTYHDSCSGLRELGIRHQARELLKAQGKCRLVEMTKTPVCCGFGGTFWVKHAALSDNLADARLDLAVATKADVLLAGDLGCLMHLASRSAARRLPIRLRHTAEVLAGYIDLPALGEAGSIDWDMLLQKSIHASS